MTLANIHQVPQTAESLKGSSAARVGALAQLSRVPGFMDTLAQQWSQRPGVYRAWDPAQVMAELNPNRYVRFDPNAGLAGQTRKLRGSMHHGTDFSGEIRGWYGDDDDAYQELVQDIELAESRGKPIGYHRDIDISRSKDKVDHATRYGSADLSRDATKEALARSLAGFGVRDMQDLGFSYDPQGNPVFYNQRTGQALPEDLFSVQSKKTVGNFGLDIDEEGNIIPTFDSTFRATRHKRQKRNAMALGAVGALAAPFAIGAIGGLTGLGAVGSGALYGAGTGALTSAIGGGDPLKGALVGGLGGGLGQYAGGTALIKGISNPALRGAAIGGITGAATGGAGAALYGGDPLKGALSGGIAGGLGGFGGGYLAGDRTGLLGKALGAVGQRAGSQFGQQLAGQLVGSPFQQRTSQQPQQQAQVMQPQIPSWLPQHAQQAIMQAQGRA